jgi:cytochrome c oxidase subunit 2
MIRMSCLGFMLFAAMAPVLAAPAPSAALLSRCTGCHGAQGEGLATVGAPALAGQQADYLARQLDNFRQGTRGYAPDDHDGASMGAVATALSAVEQTQLVSYFAQLPAAPVRAEAALVTTLDKGRALYQQTCAACHGQQAQGYAQMHTPNLRILGGDYIRRQLSNYVQGWRGTQAQTDIQGRWMRSIATHITQPDDLTAVVSYIESLAISR